MSNPDESDFMGHASKCCGVPKYPTESFFNELKSSLKEDQLKVYKERVKKYYGHWNLEFPWDDD